MSFLIRVQATEPCWIAATEGDPGRTLVRANAEVFTKRDAAETKYKLTSLKL